MLKISYFCQEKALQLRAFSGLPDRLLFLSIVRSYDTKIEATEVVLSVLAIAKYVEKLWSTKRIRIYK